jgi:fatty acid desaturase
LFLETSTTFPPKTSTWSLAELREEIRAAGLGKPAPFEIYVKFLFLTFSSFGCLFFILSRPDLGWLWRAPVAMLGAWFLTGAAMCGHDGAHGAASDRPWVNTLLAQLGFTLLGGLSVTYWRQKHNILHHPNVNVAKTDPDVEQGFLALSNRQHGEGSALVRFLQRHAQVYGFWLLGAPLVLVDLRFSSLRFVLGQIFRGTATRAHYADLAWIVAHYLLWLALPCALVPWQTVLMVYAILTPLAGYLLTFIFAPAHMPYPVVKASSDALLLQLTSTRNFRTNWFFRFTLVGLDRQIEHHISPKLSHFDLEPAREIVQAYCSRHGLPYNEVSWLRSILDTSAQIERGWKLDEIVVGAPAHA